MNDTIFARMNYAETIDYLYTRLPMFTRIGSAAFKKDLTNTIALCQALGEPQTKFRSVHVGGTNGKGSVSHMLASVFQEAGYKTGLYTSPHLHDFRERIRLNGTMVPEAFVIDFVQRIQSMIDKVEPSFFEITVAMAFDYFAKQQVDIAIIEVGLGGRLDSTNIITPELSVITNIGWDHMNMLGNTLAEIAGEKAGIIKTSVPVVIGEHRPETDDVFIRTARNKNTPVFFAEDNARIQQHQLHDDSIEIQVAVRDGIQTYQLDLPGIYQLKNIRTVLKAIDLLKEQGWALNEKSILDGLAHTKSNTGLQGRWDVIHQEPRIILEVAHNKEGIEQMLAHIGSLSFRKLHFITGMVRDKDAGAVLSLFPKDARYYFTQAQIPRALPFEELKQQAEVFGLHGVACADVNMALQRALQQADKNDIIIVCGSIFLVAEVNRNIADAIST